MKFHTQSEPRSRLHLSEWGALITAATLSLDRKEPWEQKVETTQVSALGPAPRWEKAWGAPVSSVCSTWLCWFRAMDCVKGYLTNLQGVTLEHVDIATLVHINF